MSSSKINQKPYSCSYAIGTLLLLSALSFPATQAAPIGQNTDDIDFKSTCSAQYGKRRPDENSVSASRWCGCMDRTLDSDSKLDFVNSFWLGTLDPSKKADRAKAARILNVTPAEIQDQSTPAVTTALENLMARLKDASTVATERCRTELNYKKN